MLGLAMQAVALVFNVQRQKLTDLTQWQPQQAFQVTSTRPGKDMQVLQRPKTLKRFTQLPRAFIVKGYVHG
jgi:hypothetical protein